MSDPFDPYYQWLGISPKNQPADYYRLLGVERFEANLDVIATAADQRMAHVRSFQSGPRAKLSQRVLNELATARATLLDPAKKARHDLALRARVASQQLPPPPEPGSKFGQRLEPSQLSQASPDDEAYEVEPTPEPERTVERSSERAEPVPRGDQPTKPRAAAPDDPVDDDAAVGPGDLLSDLRDASRLAALEAARLRLTKLQLPGAYQALGEHLYREGHFRQELAAEFGALDQLESVQADTPDQTDASGKTGPSAKTGLSGNKGPSAKSTARRRASLQRALGSAAWGRYGTASAPPTVNARLRELTDELARLDADIAKTGRAQPGRLLSPRWLAILVGSFLASIALVLIGTPLRYAFLVLIAVPLAFAYRQFVGSASRK